jgi:hypothetical protein
MHDEASYSDYIEKTCCGCHATGAGAESGDSLALGVHCEACHGPARDWVKEHTLKSWVSESPAARTLKGQRNTRDLVVRAGVCAQCHIGTTDVPGQEVNHDLIAAGHPRLNFEFTVYLANLPPHWDENIDRKFAERPEAGVNPGVARTNFALEAWEAGQLVSADFALRQLTGRAGRAAPWPEFAEYDCFSCHHDLRPSGFRQMAGKNRDVWTCGNWYTALAACWPVPGLEFRAPEESLQGQFVWLKARRDKLRDVATALQGQISRAVAKLPAAPGHLGPRLTNFARKLAASDLSERGWMEATQWLLAVTACFEAFDEAFERAGVPAPASLAAGKRTLVLLWGPLAFPVDEPGSDEKSDARVDFNSPRDFNPIDSEYGKIIARIKEALTQVADVANLQNQKAK